MARNRTQSATASSSFLPTICASIADSRRAYSGAERIRCLGFKVGFSTCPQGFDLNGLQPSFSAIESSLESTATARLAFVGCSRLSFRWRVFTSS